MNNWAPLWNGLVDSSIWEEPDHVFRVFMAMLSLKDANHVVSLDGYKLSKRIHMPPDKVADALKILASPDTRRPGQEFEGCRIKKVEDGWEILNGEYYRKLVSEEMRRVRNRKSQRAWRDRQKPKSIPSPGETAYVNVLESDGAAAADAHLARQEAINGSEADQVLWEAVRPAMTSETPSQPPKLDPETEKVLAELRAQDDAGEGA